MQAFLQISAERYPDRICTITDGHRLTYRDVNRLSDMVGRGLLRLGLTKGDRVAIMMPNSHEFIILYYGILKAGGVVAAVNPQYKPRELEFQLRDSGARFLIAFKDQMDVISIIEDSTAIEHVIISEPDDLHRIG
ncbi:MAG: AMP-binding protein, partial [Anaerolineae bacterium]|nr:AMP-binding protein [Anaerolineae bacterium]